MDSGRKREFSFFHEFVFKALSQICFYKKFLDILFFGDAVDKDIHEEQKNKITMKFEVKGRICDSALKLTLTG